MDIENLIVDFDGTLTDTAIEALPVIEKWAQLICSTTGIPRKEYDSELASITDEINGDPMAGWIYNGLVVAPAAADPYVLITAASDILLARHAQDGRYDVPRDIKARETYLNDIFRQSYPLSAICFKEDAKPFLEAAKEMHSVVVVTNSDTSAVLKKLDTLGVSLQVVGNAKKYKVDSTFIDIPESMQPRGFPRQVYLRRRSYFDALISLERGSGFAPSNTAVMGDIFELDLALPLYLGYHAILLDSPGVSEHERNYVTNAPNAYLAKDLSSVLEHLQDL